MKTVDGDGDELMLSFVAHFWMPAVRTKLNRFDCAVAGQATLALAWHPLQSVGRQSLQLGARPSQAISNNLRTH